LKKRLAEAETAFATRGNSMVRGPNSAFPAKSQGTLPIEDLLKRERKDPAYARLWRRIEMRTIQKQYGDVFAALNLPPDKLEKLRDLLFERLEAFQDAKEASEDAGLSNPESAKAVTQSQSEINGEIEALIGPDQYATFQQDARAGTLKSLITTGLGVDMELGGAPLTSEQVADAPYGASRIA